MGQMDHAAVNIHVPVLVWVYASFSLERTPCSEIALCYTGPCLSDTAKLIYEMVMPLHPLTPGTE